MSYAIEMDLWILERQLGYLKRYLSAIEEFLEEEEKRLGEIRQKIEESTNAVAVVKETGEDPNDYLAELAYEVQELKELTLSSFVVSVLISIEQTLIAFCNQEKIKLKQSFSYNEVKGSRGIGQTLNYLRRVLDKKEAFPFDTKTLEILTTAVTVRNAIVHADAKVRGDAEVKTIEEFLKKNPDVLQLHNPEPRIQKRSTRVTVTLEYAKLLLTLHQTLIHAIEAYIHKQYGGRHISKMREF